MMHPLTVQLLNGAEKRNRAKQVQVCQLLNQAHAARESRASLLSQVRNCLGTPLANVGRQLLKLGVFGGGQVRERAQ